MNRKYHHFMIAVYLLSDATMVALAWGVSYLMRFSLRLDLGLMDFPQDPEGRWVYLYLLPFVVLLHVVVMEHFGLYRMARRPSVLSDCWGVARASLLAWMLLLAILFVVHLFEISRYVLATFLVVNPLLLLLSRTAARLVQRYLCGRGKGFQRAVIVGAGRLGQSLHERILKNPWMGVRVVAYVDGRAGRVGREIDGVPVRPFEEFRDIITAHKVEEVFIALKGRDYEDQSDTIAALTEEVVDVRMALDVDENSAINAQAMDFCGMPMLDLRHSPMYGWGALRKRAFDIVVSLGALLVFGLPMLAIALIIRLSSKGPVFYRQERMGLDGRKFHILKFRSMKIDAEKESGAVWAVEDDPRRTRFGTFLRKTSLDELPQFLNVLAGQMSVVGPRPERPVFIEDFKREIPRYMLRHKCKAGITGWAQVNGWRGNTSLAKRIQYDLFYIRNWSLRFDIKILLMTFYRGFVSKTAY